MYGKSKLMGEISNKKNTLTIRCTILGHELDTNLSLVEWFLHQKNKVNGHKNFYTSGITTIEMANIIEHYIFPNNLNGVVHVSSESISKYDLLTKISGIYNKNINIVPDENFICNSTLDASLFKSLTGYSALPWDTMLNNMHKDFKLRYKRTVTC
jgi:dTDP-4-dehydrorhamnose reductase